MTTENTTPIAPAVRQVAAIDIGARAVRLDVGELAPDGIRILESLQKAVHLGKDTFTGGAIDSSSIEQCVDILRGFRHVLQPYGITQPGDIRTVATSSVREADNREAFLDRIYIATGLTVEVLEDAEIEQLIHLALQDLVAQDPALQRANLLVAEAGGGTTRLLLIQDGYVTYSGSFRLGSLRMRETLGPYHTPAIRLCALLDQNIRRTTDQMRQSVPADQVPTLIALAGDSAAAMARLLPEWNVSQGLARLPVTAESLAEKIVSTPVDELMHTYQLPSQEAETAGHTLLTYDRIARAFGVREILVTNRSLRTGLLLRMRGNDPGAVRSAKQLVATARALGKKCRYDEKHALFVADLCGQLFRELQAEHQLPPFYEVLLRLAAILHDIGAFVGTASHHKHSMYLIQNSDIFGLNRRDTNLVALVARYHRRAMPQPKHPEYAVLEREDRIVVLKLAALLRLADALDRSHNQKYRTLAFARAERQFIVTAQGVEDATIERAALRDKAAMFPTVFGMEVVLKTAETA